MVCPAKLPCLSQPGVRHRPQACGRHVVLEIETYNQEKVAHVSLQHQEAGRPHNATSIRGGYKQPLYRSRI